MALFKFTKGILNGESIDIYNQGEMYRDFTYVEDLARAIRLLIDVPPPYVENRGELGVCDSLSAVAPYRVVNIGNSKKIKLMDFIEAIEIELGMEAKKNFMEMQKGDVPATFADTRLLKALTGYRPDTGYREGVRKFTGWYRKYYD